MSSPVFALCLTCLFLMKTVETTDPKFSSSAHQQRDFLLFQIGDTLTLECFIEDDVSTWFYWYKQLLGQRPKLISSYYKFDTKFTFFDEFKNNPRFTSDTEINKNHLTISDLHASDSATYYCISSYTYQLKFLESITVIVEDSGSNIPTVVHHSASETIQPGGSVTLNCTVHTGTCAGEHSVYLFKNSAESQQGLIYTHGGSNDQCERKPDTQTHACKYNLAMENLNVSHAGIYYCAVASCGHILFGNSTKLDFTNEANSPILLYMLSGALTFVALLVVLLSVSLYKMKKTNRCQSTESQVRFPTYTTANTQGHQEEHSLHYAALSVNLPNRSKRQRNNTETECVYSSMKQ